MPFPALWEKILQNSDGQKMTGVYVYIIILFSYGLKRLNCIFRDVLIVNIKVTTDYVRFYVRTFFVPQ